MKIALINDLPQETGIGNYAFSLFEELKKSADAEMLFLDFKNSDSIAGNGLKRLAGFGFPFFSQVLNNAFVFPKMIPAGFDVYHASNQYLSHMVAGRSAGVVSCMDIVSLRFAADYNPAVSYFWNRALRQMKNAKKIIAISQFTSREIQKMLGIARDKIEVIPLAFDEKAFRPMKRQDARKELGLEEGAKIILNVGSEEKRKNIPTLLRAFAAVAKENEDALLVRIGEKRKETAKLARELGIDGRVKYYGSLPKEKLALAYNAADVLAFCSYYEGFGLPLLEAMACGTAVVASRAASIPEIVGGSGMLIDNPLDADGFASAILDLFEKPALKKSLEIKGFGTARGFSWKKNCEATLRVYGEALG